MKHSWFKIWAVGNGGMECYVKFVFWPDYGDDELSSMVEHELGPFPSSVRSVHWERMMPPKDVVQKRIDEIEQNIKYLNSELNHHKKHLPNE